MGETALVEGKIQDSIALIRQLDQSGQEPSVAVWYYYPDADEWRLLLAGPSLDSLLPKQEPVAYRVVIDAMGQLTLSALTISDLKLVETKSVVAQSLRGIISTGKGIARAHFTDLTANRIFIKEMVVLRYA